MFELLITILHIFVALFMILVVLVQGGNQGGMGAAFGGGNSAGVFGATGATTLLGKLTYGAAAVFMVTSVSLTIMRGSGGETGLSEELKKAAAAEQSVPATETAPGGETVPGNEAAPAGSDNAAPVDEGASMSAPEDAAPVGDGAAGGESAPGAANEEVTP